MRRFACWSLGLALAASAVQAQAPSTPRPTTLGEPFPFAPLPPSELPKIDEPKLPPNPLVELLKPTIQVRGRIDADAIVAVQSQQSRATIGDLQNAYGFRRARIGAEGKLGEAATWVVEAELAG